MINLNKIETFKKYLIGGAPVWFFLFLAQALRRSHGHLRLAHLVYLTISFCLFLVYWKLREKRLFSELTLPKNLFYVVLALFCFELTSDLHVIYMKKESLGVIINYAYLVVGFLTFALIKIKKPIFSKKVWPIAAIGLGILTLCLTPILSPEPVIDVWSYQQKAVEYFLSFKNPYEFKFPHLYGADIGSTYGYPYWPLLIYVGSIGKVLLGDIRFSFVFLYLMMFLFWIKNKKVDHLLLWLFFPVQFFVLEQAWTEGLVIPLVFFHLEFLRKKNWVGASLVLGLICGAKQTMVFYFLFHFIYLIRMISIKELIKNFLLTVIVALITFLPYLVWNLDAFVTETIFDVLGLKARKDALSWSSYLLMFYGAPLNKWVYLSLVVSTLIGASYALLRRRKLADFICANIAMYMVTFLFGKQAFCNYYFFIVFLLLYLIDLKDIWRKVEAKRLYSSL